MVDYKLIILLVALAGCAAHPDPIVDMKGVDPERLARDQAKCEQYAEQIRVRDAAAGAINGDVSRGAANGALYGGTRSGLGADRDKQKVVNNCLRGRGYRVLN